MTVRGGLWLCGLRRALWLCAAQIGYFGRPFETKKLREIQGDEKDYLRFVLRYLAARRRGMPPVPARAAAPGGSGAADAFPDLCSNMDVQTDSFKEFAANFAALFAQHVDTFLRTL